MPYTIIETTTRPDSRIQYKVAVSNTEAVDLRFASEVDQATIDGRIDYLLARRAKKAEDQAKIDKAIAEALWTDEERANLG